MGTSVDRCHISIDFFPPPALYSPYMKKQKSFVFKCSACGHEEPKWLGRCPECGEWNTLIETAAAAAGRVGIGGRGSGSGERSALPQFPFPADQKQQGRVLYHGKPLLPHGEYADLIHRSEAVFHRPQEAAVPIIGR